MSKTSDQGIVSDEELVAYLDDEIDGARAKEIETLLEENIELRARLDLLRQGDRPFADAYDALLQTAPVERLETMLEDVCEKRAKSVTSSWRRGSAGAWLALPVLVLLAGILIGYLASRTLSGPETEAPVSGLGEKNWRQAVAEYQILYSRATLDHVKNSPDATEQSFKNLSKHLGRELVLKDLQLNRYTFKRGQVLSWRGRPLIQMTYLPEEGRPLAFCITPVDQKNQELKKENREGMNIVHWVQDRFGLMVIGWQNSDELERVARKLKKKLDRI